MRPFSWRFIRVWQRNRDVFFRLWHSEVPGFIAEPVVVLVAFGFGLGTYIGLVGGQSYMEFIAPGIIASYAMFSASFECTYASFIRMEYQNTYDAILTTPLNVEDIIAGEIFWGATRSLMTGSVILFIALAFQLVHSPWAALIPAVALLEGVMFASIALFYTSLVPAIYTFNYYFTLFITPMFFLSGVFFPIENFPTLVQRIAWAVPLTSVVRLNRALFQGEFNPSLLIALAIMVLVAAVFFSLAMFTMRRRLTT
jgi:lipooligosaccharide transport system permease protein